MPRETSEILALPCRGCTLDCPNRAVCDHRPWRCAPGAYAAENEPGPEVGSAPGQ